MVFLCITGGTSSNLISCSDEEQSTTDQKMVPDNLMFMSNTSQQLMAAAVMTNPDIIAMDLLNNIEEDSQNISQQDTIINPLVRITMTDGEMIDYERQSITTNNIQPIVVNDILTESSMVTTNSAEEMTQTAIAEASGKHSESEESSDNENRSPNKSCKRHLASCKAELRRSTKQHAATELKFRSFLINWEKISDNLLIKLRNLQQFKNTSAENPVPQSLRFTKSNLSCFINEVVNQLRLIDIHIRSETMENVSKQILQKYSCLDFYDDDGFGVGQWYIELKYKMINRNNYLNRFNDQETSKPRLTLKKKRNIRAGTDREYWEKCTKECNKELFSKLLRDEPDLLTDEFLEMSQSFVRYTLDQQGELTSVVTQLPVLRRRKLLNFHFQRATGVDIGCLREYVMSKRNKIIDYSLTCRKHKHLKETDEDIELFKFLCSLVGEQFEHLVISKEVNLKLSLC